MVADVEDENYVTPELIQSYLDKFNKATKGSIDRNTVDSADWFRKRLSKDLNPNRMSLINSHGDYNTRKGTEKSLIGRLYYFKYLAHVPGDPELPIYDQFPMVFIFNTSKSSDGDNLIHALNVHYLQPKMRGILLYKLLKLKNNKTWGNRTKLKLSWELIKAHVDHNMYKHAVKAYRVDRIKSRLIEIIPKDWEIAVFLRLEKWVHISDDVIYASDVRKVHRDRK